METPKMQKHMDADKVKAAVDAESIRKEQAIISWPWPQRQGGKAAKQKSIREEGRIRARVRGAAPRPRRALPPGGGRRTSREGRGRKTEDEVKTMAHICLKSHAGRVVLWSSPASRHQD